MLRRKIKKVIPFERGSEFFFRLGTKYADKRNYSKAHRYMEKAIEMEPYNVDFHFSLAGIAAEMGNIENSNVILKGILMNIDPTLTECYFGIGCNYFDAEDFGKAREYFEKYLYFDPEGDYADDVNDVLYYLQVYDGGTGTKGRLKSGAKLVRDGQKLLQKGDYKKASEKFEAALEFDPSAVSARNYLSWAYFHEGDMDKAISLALSVLKLDYINVEAHCNLSLYYNQAGREQQYKEEIKTLHGLQISRKEDLLKILDTCVRMKEFSGMGKVLRNYLGNRKEFIEALEETLDGWNVSGEKKKEIVNGLSSQRRKINKKESRID